MHVKTDMIVKTPGMRGISVTMARVNSSAKELVEKISTRNLLPSSDSHASLSSVILLAEVFSKDSASGTSGS